MTPLHPYRKVARWSICGLAALTMSTLGLTWLIDHHTTSVQSITSQSTSTPHVAKIGAQSKKLKLLQWNVFMLPLPLGYAHDPACRARSMSHKLLESGADIITLNETYNRIHMRHITEPLRSRYPHQLKSLPAAKGKRKFNGGLTFLSKHPVKKTHIQAFKACQGVDCASNKGFVHTLVEVDGQHKLNILMTHLNGGLGASNNAMRAKQTSEIMAYAKSNKDIQQWPTLLVGDLNANGIRYNTYRMPPKAHELTDYGELMRAMGNTCVACKDEQCRAKCTNYPQDNVRAQRGKWNYTPNATKQLNGLNCVGPTLSMCLDLNETKYWVARQRFDYILSLAPPTRAPKKQAKLSKTVYEDWSGSNCEGDYLSMHKPMSTQITLP